MDFDNNVTKVQGTLYSLGSQGLLNESGSLPHVVETLKECICNLSDAAKSKITFLMVLNTQLAVSEELKNDAYVCLFTDTSPYIEKEYLITYVYHLNLQPQLFRVIENCPSPLSLELLDVIIKKLKESAFHRDEFGIEHFYQLWKSVFVKICKIHARLHLNESCDPFMTYFQEVYNLIEKVLVAVLRFSSLKVFVGFHLYNFFKSILCFLQHKKLNLADDSVFQLSMKSEDEKDDTNIDHIKACNSLVFENIFKILENLTVDLWLTLSECYFDFDPKNSVQLLIGNLICSIIDEVKHFELATNVLDCLSSLAIKKSDLIANANIDEIIANVNNGEVDWFSALVSNHDFSNKLFVECLLDHLHLASTDDLNAILKNSYDYLWSCQEKNCPDLVKKLFLKAAKVTHNPLPWLEKVLEKFKLNFLTTADTQSEMVETFNKISTKKNVEDCDVISLCMQSPFDTINKICYMGVCCSHLTNFIIDILKLLKQACETCLKDGFTVLDYVLLKCILNELNEPNKQPFINFVVELTKENLLRHSFFINLLKSLKGYLEGEILERAVVCLEVVKLLLDLKLFQVEEAAFLVFMSQVLGYFSWNLRDFSVVKAEGRDVAGCIVALVIDGLDDINVTGPGYHWARKEIMNSWEINQAHFCDLWSSCGNTWPGSRKIHCCILALAHSRNNAHIYAQFLISFGEPFHNRSSIVTALSMVLPTLGFREWDSIFSQLIIVLNHNKNSRKSDVDVYYIVLDMIGSALFVLTYMLNLDREQLHCYQHCLRNFGRLVGSYCPKMSGESFLGTLKQFFLIIQTFEAESERKICLEICSPALIRLIDCMKRKKIVDFEKSTENKMPSILDLKEIEEVINKYL